MNIWHHQNVSTLATFAQNGDSEIRTQDLPSTKPLCYQLTYPGLYNILKYLTLTCLPLFTTPKQCAPSYWLITFKEDLVFVGSVKTCHHEGTIVIANLNTDFLVLDTSKCYKLLFIDRYVKLIGEFELNNCSQSLDCRSLSSMRYWKTCLVSPVWRLSER